jgi:hypothetical protein
MLRPVVDSMSWDSAIYVNGLVVEVVDASPLLMSWPYQAGKIYLRLKERYGESAEFLNPLKQMYDKLVLMARRWKVGGSLQFHSD